MIALVRRDGWVGGDMCGVGEGGKVLCVELVGAKKGLGREV